jgi:polyferredoxin
MVLIFVYSLALRVPLAIDAIRDRNQLYRENSEGLIENVYTLKIMNKSQQEQQYHVSLTGDEHIKLMPIENFSLAAGEISNMPVTLQADPAELTQANTKIVFKVDSVDDKNITAQTESRFIAPTSH